jgi:hypothetical protein
MPLAGGLQLGLVGTVLGAEFSYACPHLWSGYHEVSQIVENTRPKVLNLV